MTSAAARDAYSLLSDELRADPDDDVTLTPEGLAAKGKLFAFPLDDELVVALPAARAADLVSRGVATAHTADAPASGDWVRVDSLELWSELASEAHSFVGEPPVGRQS
jgi:hypothetical protein